MEKYKMLSVGHDSGAKDDHDRDDPDHDAEVSSITGSVTGHDKHLTTRHITPHMFSAR